MKKKRSKVTPKWLSILRKVYTYGGIATIISMLEGRWGLTLKDVALILELYGIGAIIIQALCDASSQKTEDVYKQTP